MTTNLPTIFDPFCGGGSTLIEAQRLGLPTIGSDLNPVPVLVSIFSPPSNRIVAPALPVRFTAVAVPVLAVTRPLKSSVPPVLFVATMALAGTMVFEIVPL